MSEGKVYAMQDVSNPVDMSVVEAAARSSALLDDMRDAKFCPTLLRVDKGLQFGSAAVVPYGAKQYASFVRDIQLEVADCVVFTEDSGYTGPTHKLTRGLTTCHPAGTTTLLGYVPYIVADINATEKLFAFYNKDNGSISMVLAPDASLVRKAQQIIANLGKMHKFPRVCSYCGASSPSHRDCPCKAAQYCDGACQKRHWKAHRKQCAN
jgi:hypothetical protein